MKLNEFVVLVLKAMHVRGRLFKSDHFGKESVFMAFVSPLLTPDSRDNVIVSNTNCFRSVLALDLKFQELSQRYKTQYL